ncbi:serine/threonine protein kinase [Blastopirellula marina]|uniref:non-specific serine/threonine protein kinase n=1 Tax=Blastopirellula marina TaxID=124 RepID=A0A2S8G3V6_9BACT|nr:MULTISPECIES: serine/threonine-protein kinase [Pirellulaceae]PQO39117.1 serine/threonine protein kinase [Blastopirellula marina]RCS55425.1 serine/threonine protein kinase [Bremerella cremea]
MPAVVDSQRFIELIDKSKLVDPAALEQAVEALRASNEGELPNDLDALQKYFVEKQLLTSWHCEKLRNGKYKGFYLSKYRLLKHLGTGGMSSVYLAEHTLMNRKVAIKVLPRRRVNDASYLARFHLEAQAAAHLDHPNIVRAFDVDNEDNTHYIVMEYVPGADLQQIVRESGPVPFEAAADYIAQAADGLQHAHEKGVVHRDVKPANLLRDDRGIVKILDMGLARISQDENASLTIAHEENVLGTADYLSPEQAVNSHKVDHRADIYSLGCSLYYLLTGHPPFPEGSLAQRIAKHQSVMPDPIAKSRPNCPPSLQRICEKMIAKRPEDRFDSAADVAHELRMWMESRGKEPTQLDEQPGSAILSTSALEVANRSRAAHHSNLPRGGGGGGSSYEVDDLLPPDMRDSPSSSNFDPAVGDTIADRSNDTSQRPIAPKRPSRSGESLPVAKALDDDEHVGPASIDSLSSSGSSLFDSQEFDADPFSMDVPASDVGGSLLISSAELKQQAEDRHAAAEAKKRRTESQSGLGDSINTLNASIQGIPIVIWVVVAVLFMLIGILIAISYQTAEETSEPIDPKKGNLEARRWIQQGKSPRVLA